MGFWIKFSFAILLLVSSLTGNTTADDEEETTNEDDYLFCPSNFPMYDNLEEACKDAKDNKKLMVIFIHKSWCKACHSLKKKVCKSKAILSESEKFVMVSLGDDDEPKGSALARDGRYYPRIYFMDYNQNVLYDIKNTVVKTSAKYCYYSAYQLLKSMRKVNKLYN